ncbi:MAG: FAD-dependent oxidoreductase [Saprospiraceae bacterium]|nr:FAD-dependent oxidoreductase [Saprospiraceae bacterium]
MHIVIIGNGIAGISTARHIRKLSQHEITVISSESQYFWSRTALMYIYMGHMKFEHTQPYENHFWVQNRINLVQQHVSRIDPAAHALYLADGSRMAYDRLVLATGSRPNKYGWPGQDLKGVQGMVSKQDLDSLIALTPEIQQAVVVGGGLIGIELAEMLHSRHIPVTYLVRERSFWINVLPPEESAMINAEIQGEHGIHLRLNTELQEILGDEQGRVRAVITKQGDEIPCQFVGITVGVSPNIDLAREAGIETGRGFLVDEYLETSVKDIYAIGDCAELRHPQPGRRAIEAVWYTGKQMGPVLARTLCQAPEAYRPDLWFNSAKFINLEYQVYGDVANTIREGEKHLFWQHPTEHKAVRLVYAAADGRILGFNLMGIRYRQEVCHHWIRQGAHIEEVLQNLGAANFDPEFFKAYEADVVALYNQQHPGRNLQLKRRKGLKQALEVLGRKVAAVLTPSA